MVKKQKEFREMTKKERKDFLDMDFIERMTRVEQHISKTFGEQIPYNETEVYKNLSERDKKRFNEHVKKNKNGKKMLAFLVGIPMLLFFLSFNFQITGHVVGTGRGFSLTLFQLIVLIATLTILTIFGIAFLFKNKKHKKFNKHIEVINQWLEKEK